MNKANKATPGNNGSPQITRALRCDRDEQADMVGTFQKSGTAAYTLPG
jgi:hypothetical protein